MFRVVLKNVGKDMVNKDFVVDTTNVSEVTCKAFSACIEILGTAERLMFELIGVEINIMVCNTIVGSLTITKLH